ncbi:MAG TPA: imidazole glycerol phosphate synthase subunit HisH [Clostridia bacterium]|nr:imidazole glycerol phosphate synthase subunit HisH [Clostridia bacterium]
MIIILDYGLGNVYNLQNALSSLGYDSKISRNPDDILKASILFLPGVGAFKSAMKNLGDNNLIKVLNKRNEEEKPIIGICLGMQVLFNDSYEDGYCKGLGYIKGSFKKFDIDLKIPHMGWNKLIENKVSFVTKDLPENSYVYFVHSYYLTDYDPNDLIAYAEYAIEVPAIVGKNHLVGIQFHPEKSNKIGLQILDNLIRTLKKEGA